jgi:hypothetical protein
MRPNEQHAPAGGVRVSGQYFGGGWFLPFYIPRERMPQVDEADYPALLTFVQERGVVVTKCVAAPALFHAHQRIDFDRAISMDEKTLSKPILTSVDYYVLDGNHRWMGHFIHHTDLNVIKIGLEFEAALDLLFQFPKTYSYGDGNVHPIRN